MRLWTLLFAKVVNGGFVVRVLHHRKATESTTRFALNVDVEFEVYA